MTTFPPHEPPAREIRVWDLATRIFHWSLVTLVLFASLTGWVGPEWMLSWHVAAGSAVALLLAWRVIWGFYGPGPSQFRDFVRPWPEVVRHLWSVLKGRPIWHAGHNPAGGWMIMALLTTLTLILLTGVVALGGEEKQGVLAGLLSYGVGHLFKEIHEGLVSFLFFLIPVHIAGVLVESLLQRENLVRAMITGCKSMPLGQPEPRLAVARPWRAWVWGAMMVGILWTGQYALGLAREAVALPPLAPNPVYAQACGECHWAFHPSLLPAASWHRMLISLQNHFGEDATLDAVTLEQVEPYLQRHAAQSWDTEVAHRFRKISLQEPLRVTATPFWQKKHRQLPEAVYAVKTVGARSNCPACHQDAATGLFEDQAIQLPKEIRS